MEVILKEDVVNLGYKDDIVNVKKGYARNYLIPQGKAIIATDSSKKILAENLKQRAHKLEQIKATAQTLAERWKAFHSRLVQKPVLPEQFSVRLPTFKLPTH